MLESSPYRNTIDEQLSTLAEGDTIFKAELIEIYTEYMAEIQRGFALFMRQQNREELALLHHKHKTTCHVLMLKELSKVFEQARDLLETAQPASANIETLINRVNVICNAAQTQLEAI